MQKWQKNLGDALFSQLRNWDSFVSRYQTDDYVYEVRGKEIRQPMVRLSLSGTKIRRVVTPKLKDWGDRLKFLRLERLVQPHREHLIFFRDVN